MYDVVMCILLKFLQYSVSSGSSVKVVSRRYLYDLMKQCPQKGYERRLIYLEEKLFNILNYSEAERSDLKHKLSHFKSQFKYHWKSAHNKEDSFLKNNEKWLDGTITFPIVSSGDSYVGAGRPSKPFEESSARTKRRKTQHLRQEVPTEVLTFATQMSLKAKGKLDASKVIKDITSSPKRATKYRKAFTTAQNKSQQLTSEQALSIFVEAGLSRRQYQIVRSGAKSIYPCYSLLQKAKIECYPNREAYRITQTCAEIRLQDLLDHTALRLTKYLQDVLQMLTNEERKELLLISKWGCDGTQQTQYKQKFENTSDSDANIFQSSFVLIRLIVKGNVEKIVWQNPTPSSPRFCRPIRIRFVHETVDITNEEIQYVENQVKQLQNTTSADENLSIEHRLLLTMVDAKVCNAATNTKSTMQCYICNATSKEFNLINVREENINPESLRFGLSILHARIRFFEGLLHLSYKLSIGKWQARSKSEKELVATTKKNIQDKFRNQLGLLVDIPKPGFGNTNDGNTSRRFFHDPVVASGITGIDEGLIHRFKIILETLSSGHEIDVSKFKSYCVDTAKLYVKLYSWYPMSPTIHKILVHGSTIISQALLSIGQLSEEAAEARNKHFRLYRANYARKFTREDCNMDVINRLLLTSDPFLSSSRPTSKKTSEPFSTETLNMLRPGQLTTTDEDNDEDESSDDEE